MILKIIRVIVLLPVVLALNSCDSDNTLSTPELAGLGYFPMQVGNRWTYSLQNSEQTVWNYEIVDKTRIGYYQYFVLKRHFIPGIHIDSVFYRAGSSDKIYRHWQGKDALYIDFSRSRGKKWDSFGEYRGVINKMNISKTVPAGTFHNCIEVFFDIPMAYDDETWEVYAPQVGLLEMRGPKGSVQLKSAVVNGVSIP